MTYVGPATTITVTGHKFTFSHGELIILRAALRRRNETCDGNAGEITTRLLSEVTEAIEADNNP